MEGTYHRVSPRIIDENLMQSDNTPTNAQAHIPAQNQPAPVETGNWFSNMSMNKKIAFSIVVAVLVISILVIIVRYYNSQPAAPQQPMQPPPQVAQAQAQQAQAQAQAQQMQNQQAHAQQAQAQAQNQQMQNQQAQAQAQAQQAQMYQQNAQMQTQAQQNPLQLSKNEALEELKAVTENEKIVGKSLDDIYQLMSSETTETKITDDITPESSETASNDNDYCNAVTTAGKTCKNRIKSNGKCHLHIE